jgi:hypothetical protein
MLAITGIASRAAAPQQPGLGQGLIFLQSIWSVIVQCAWSDNKEYNSHLFHILMQVIIEDCQVAIQLC